MCVQIKKPEIIVFAGPNGSGKTTVTKLAKVIEPYINADEKECSVKLEIKYDAGLYEVLLSGLADYMKEKRGIEKIAIFDKEHIMIYFGDRTENFKTTRDIWNYYRQAYTYQVIWYSYGGRVICIEPEKAVTPESSPETEAESTAENEIF